MNASTFSLDLDSIALLNPVRAHVSALSKIQPDGCGGSCGKCNGTLGCVDGQCKILDQPGTCANPIPLNFPVFNGSYVFSGIGFDTSQGINVMTTTCNQGSAAKELMYKFTVPDGVHVGADIRITGYDTTLEIRKGVCNADSASIACNDDNTPPGNFGSRVTPPALGPGDYFIMVDGYSASQTGPFVMTIMFVPNCVPNCDGRYCGNDTSCSAIQQNLCGSCDAGLVCGSGYVSFALGCSP